MQPMQQQGIASIGGEATGAGGGMVSFTDGGGVRRFATPNDGKDVRHFQEAGPVTSSATGRVFSGISEGLSKIPNFLSGGAEGAAERGRRDQLREDIRDVQNKITTLGGTFGLAQQTPEQQKEYEELLEKRTNLSSQLIGRKPTVTKPVSTNLGEPDRNGPTTYTKAPPSGLSTAEKPAANNAGDNVDNATPVAGGNLNLQKMYKDYEKNLVPLFEKKVDAANAGITALTNAQTAMLPYYDPKKLAEFNPTDAERETSRQAKQTDLEKAFPNPYTKTANTLELLQKNLENSEANTFNKALFKASLALMGSKSPKFFQAASEAGLVGVEDYGRMQDANQKQRMALMNADTALATAQDSRKRGLYDQSAKQVSESLQFKKDAFLADRDATLAKGNMAIALEGKKAELPDLKIKQAQDLFNLQHGLYTDIFKIAEFNQRGAQIKASSTPEMGKMIEWAAKNPQYAGQIYDEKSRAMYNTVIKEGMEIFAKDQISTPEQKKVNFDALIKSAIDNYTKQYPRPLETPRLQ